MNNDLQFDQTNPSILDSEIIKKNYIIIDAFYQEKHDKKYVVVATLHVIEMLQLIFHFLF